MRHIDGDVLGIGRFDEEPQSCPAPDENSCAPWLGFLILQWSPARRPPAPGP